jgi:hypothetical protein
MAMGERNSEPVPTTSPCWFSVLMSGPVMRTMTGKKSPSPSMVGGSETKTHRGESPQRLARRVLHRQDAALSFLLRREQRPQLDLVHLAVGPDDRIDVAHLGQPLQRLFGFGRALLREREAGRVGQLQIHDELCAILDRDELAAQAAGRGEAHNGESETVRGY